MTPAALHRLAFHGEDDPQFLKIGSRLVVVAAFPLALGISADVAVVAYKITERSALSLIMAGAVAVVFLAVWYVYPLVARERATCCPAPVKLRSNWSAISPGPDLVGKAGRSFVRRFWSTFCRFTSDVERVPAGRTDSFQQDYRSTALSLVPCSDACPDTSVGPVRHLD
jgi:hypothetical protein